MRLVVLLWTVSAVAWLQRVESGKVEARAFLRGDTDILEYLDKENNLPVVLWHGMGDSCCASYSIGAIKALIEDKLGVYVHSIATGSTAVADVWSSYFGDVNDQVAKVCAELREIPELAQGYNAVGFSQGGQFMRAVVERCQHLGPKANMLVTLGAQHQGVSNIPGCSAVPTNLTSKANGKGACETMQTLLGRGAYLPWVRDHVVQAQYFKDPHRLHEYLQSNPFLPDINNEKDEKNEQYKTNLASLNKLVLFRFADDDTVVPRDSSWFYFFDGHAIIPLEEQDMYKEDWIGLRELHEKGRLEFEEVPGKHMQFTLSWFEEHVLQPYLASLDSAGTGMGGEGRPQQGQQHQQMVVQLPVEEEGQLDPVPTAEAVSRKVL